MSVALLPIALPIPPSTPLQLNQPAETVVAFQALRLLMLNRFLWGRQAGVGVADLGGMLSLNPAETEQLVAQLDAEGWIARDHEAHTVWLTARAARDLLRVGG